MTACLATAGTCSASAPPPYGEASDDYTAASEAINAFAGIDTGDEEFDAGTALEEIKDFQPTEDTATVDVEDEETLAINEMTAY